MPSKHKKTEKSNTEEVGGTDNIHEEPLASANQTSAEATVPTNTDIMEAIAKLSGSFDRKFDDLSSTLTELNVSIANITSRVAATEEAAKVHETHIESLEKRCAHLEAECEKRKEKTCDLESRSRRQNI